MVRVQASLQHDDVGFDEDDLAVTVALNTLCRLLRYKAADGGGVIADGQGCARAEEVLSRIGVVKPANIIKGLNFLGWGLEMVRRRDHWYFLSLWDGCENDGLL